MNQSEARTYSQRLGAITAQQFQRALDRFGLGRFVAAEPIESGLFGQNVFVTSTAGRWVLRGDPHYDWQFPTEAFFAYLIHKRSAVPVLWPYQHNRSSEIFGWEHVLMPHMPGIHIGHNAVRNTLSADYQTRLAGALDSGQHHVMEKDNA